MSSDAAKTKRILHIKVKNASPDATRLLTSMMKNTASLYRAFGDVRIRLLRNADDPAQFIQVVEYQADQGLELSRQKLASDPLTYNLLQTWRTFFPGAIEADVYEDVTEGL